jgi:hypothetical protein
MDNDARAQMVRLFEAATQAGLIPAEGQPSALARLLNISSQIVTNWQARGISDRGLIMIQRDLGINATYIETGAGPVYVSKDEAARDPPSESEWAELDVLRALAPVVKTELFAQALKKQQAAIEAADDYLHRFGLTADRRKPSVEQEITEKTSPYQQKR